MTCIPCRTRILLEVDLCPLAIFIILFNRSERLHFLSKAKAAGKDVLLGPETIFPSGLDKFRLPDGINVMVAEIDRRS